jgi:hypothetical protein
MTLNLEDNQHFLPQSLSVITTLTNLNISSTKYTKNEHLSTLVNLTNLDISYTVSITPEILPALPKMRHLNLTCSYDWIDFTSSSIEVTREEMIDPNKT